MIAKIEIKSELVDNIFGQYKAKYLSEERINVVKNTSTSELPINCILNKEDECTVDCSAVRVKLIVGQIYNVNVLTSIYANNPKMGIVLTVIELGYYLLV